MAARPATRATASDPPTAPSARPVVRDLSRGAGLVPDRLGRPAGLRLRVQPVGRRRLDRRPAGGRSGVAGATQGRRCRPTSRTKFSALFDSEICDPRRRASLVDQPDVRTAARLRRRASRHVDKRRDPGRSASTACDEPGAGDAGRSGARRRRRGAAGARRALPEYNREARLEVLARPGAERPPDRSTSCSDWPARSRRSRRGSRRSSSATTTPRGATATTLAPADLIERTTGGIRWLPEPGVRRVILAPVATSRGPTTS